MLALKDALKLLYLLITLVSQSKEEYEPQGFKFVDFILAYEAFN